MGEYEDRYPEAYGHGGETPAVPPGKVMEPPRQVRDVPWDKRQDEQRAAAERARASVPPARPAADRPAADRLAEPVRPAADQPAMLSRPPAEGRCRGLGPRGYRRSPARIYEDVCDRLADDPGIDASDIEVGIAGGDVTLDGTVEHRMAYRQAEAIAAEVSGVVRVRNNLRLRSPPERRDPNR